MKKSWRESALDLGQEGADEKYGWGLLNVSKSIELAKSVGGETLEDLLGSPHFGGTNASKQVNVTANGSTVMLNVSIEFTGDDNAIVDLGTADEELIYAFGTGQVWDSTQSGCRAYHSASVANDPNVSPYPSMDYHAEICGKPGAYNVLTNFQDLTYNLRHYEEIVQNMCSSCSFYNTVWNNYRSRCGDPRSYGGCTYSTLVLPSSPNLVPDRCYYQNKNCGQTVRCYSNSDCGSNGFFNFPFFFTGNVYDSYTQQ